MGYIKLFNDIAAYQDYMNGDPLLPNVSLVEENEGIFYVRSSENKNEYLILKYNVTDTSNPTSLMNFSTNVETMMIDGEEVTPNTSYIFGQTGEHEVKIKFVDNSVIAANTFAGKSNIVEIVQFPDELRTLEIYAFAGCNGLTTLDLGKYITSIHADSFDSCMNLQSVKFSESMTTIPAGIFSNMTNLKEITLTNSILTIEGGAFIGTGIKELIFPENLQTIGASAFNGVSGITEVVIPQSVSSIGKQAFKNCSNLMTLTIQSPSIQIDEYAFDYCTMLKQITMLATTAPNIISTTFGYIPSNGTLFVPNGCTDAYSSWMSMEEGYFGERNWNIQELP